MTAPKAAPRGATRWRVILTLSIVVGLVSIQCANRPAATGPQTPEAALASAATQTPAGADQAPHLCVTRATQGPQRFSSVHGLITYSDGSEILAVDPEHPANQISLGSKGLAPIAWSRDGSRLLLVESRRINETGGEARNLCVLNSDGSQTSLTRDGVSDDGSFSPGGTQVAFGKVDDGLYVIDAMGGTPRLIAKSYMAWWLGSPAWSPDGSRIAYIVYKEGGPNPGYEIWTVSPDGTNPQPLVDVGECGGGGCYGGLAWSPDGSMLAFQSDRDTGQRGAPSWAIYVMRADGSGLHRISQYGDLQPSWSPDGSRLAFSRMLPRLYPGSGDLYTMAADGSDVRHVEGVVVSPAYGRALAWNPVR